LIRDIESLTKRKLCVYFANPFEEAQIDGRDTSFMAELLGDVDQEPVDLLIQTPGGFTAATEALVSLVQNMTKEFRAIVPNAAKSNGTLLCLAATSIVMGSSSQLGPIEPIVAGVPCSILIQPQIAQQNFSLHMHGIWALQQTRTLAKRLLTEGMMKGTDEARIDQTVHILSSRDVYFDHGSVIDHAEAIKLGLKIEYLGPLDDIWRRIWLLYCMYDFNCRKSGYLKVFEGRGRSTAVSIPPKLAGEGTSKS
jgi:ATP-dependent protease ClpP protease subunit